VQAVGEGVVEMKTTVSTYHLPSNADLDDIVSKLQEFVPEIEKLEEELDDANSRIEELEEENKELQDKIEELESAQV